MKKKAFDAKRCKKLEAELDRITSVLRHAYDPEKIIVFGSFAQGATSKWSDLDIAIVKETSMRFIDRLKYVANLIDSDVAADFVVYTPREFQQMARENYFVQEEILQKGTVVYDKNSPL